MASERARPGAEAGRRGTGPASEREGGLVLDIVVQPRAPRVAVGPMLGDRLKVAVHAPPVDGEANAAVVEALAGAFAVRRAAISIVAGQTGRRKTVRIEGIGLAALERVLGR